MADANALAGLRRLVLHAQNLLSSTVEPLRQGGRALYPPEVAAYSARLLASQVLQLVADCLPEDDVFDGEIDGWEEQALELKGQREAALAIHVRADWNIELCGACTYDDRQVVYPCPTALALGIEEPPF